MTLAFHPSLVQFNLCSELHLLTFFQVLSVTCDNVAPNDTMIDKLAKLLEEFPGAANRTRCFTHILNLVAKSIMKQFDLLQTFVVSKCGLRVRVCSAKVQTLQTFVASKRGHYKLL